MPNWDQVSQKKVRDALLILGLTILDLKQAFGPKEQVDLIHHLIGTAVYLNITPGQNDGATTHKLVVKDVPTDSCWAVTLNKSKNSLERSDDKLRWVDDINAKKEVDGSVTIQFGGCSSATINCVPITPGWSYTVRLYRPRKEILDGTWKFPGAQPVN